MTLGPPPPGYRDAFRAFKAGDLRRAQRATDRLLVSSPADIRVRTLSAMLAARAGKLADSERTLLDIIAHCPDEDTAFGIRHQLALVHLQQRRLGDALNQIDLALAAAPDSPVLVAAKADMLLTANRRDEADALLTDALERAKDAPNLTLATTYARLHARTDHRDRAIALLERAIPANAPPRMDIRRAILQLGALYEHAQRFDEAFDCYHRAGALSPVMYDPRATASLVDRIIDRWTPDAVANAPRSHGAQPTPVFIVGMPRSGTSLTERILTSHPSVEGVGESDALSDAAALSLGAEGTPWRAEPHPPAKLTAPDFQNATSEYARQVLTPNAHAKRVTDKHPMNFWRLGIIPLMFPGAHIIHCVRDPRDTCVSCFAQHFVGDHPWANRLEDLGHFYRQYARLMAHWERVLPEAGAKLTRAVYEDMVTEQETESRRLIQFLGLPWDDVCLRPHESDQITWTHSNEQVRQPVYTSSAGRWRRFGARLDPLITALGDAID